MSSYIIQKQSRGVGAVAAHDLGATSRMGSSMMRSPLQVRQAAKAPATPAGRAAAFGALARKKFATQPVTARKTFRGTPKSFSTGVKGILLPPPRKLTQVAVRAPTPHRSVVVTSGKPGYTWVSDSGGGGHWERERKPAPTTTITETPATTAPAGQMPGEPPATSTPVAVTPAQTSAIYTGSGPSLSTAVEEQQRQYDEAMEAARDEAEISAPAQAPKHDYKKWLIFGGAAVGAVGLVWLLMKKR